jgi:hypothetical protein
MARVVVPLQALLTYVSRAALTFELSTITRRAQHMVLSNAVTAAMSPDRQEKHEQVKFVNSVPLL